MMTSHLGEYSIGLALCSATEAVARRKTVSQILRAAYRKHGRDRHTKLALKRYLRGG